MNFLASMNVFTSSFAVIVIFLSEMMNRCEHVFFIIINVIIDERYYFNADDFFQETSEILVERIFEMIEDLFKTYNSFPKFQTERKRRFLEKKKKKLKLNIPSKFDHQFYQKGEIRNLPKFSQVN